MAERGKRRQKTNTNSERNIVPILKVGIASTSEASLLRAVTAHLTRLEGRKGNANPLLLVTPNPEIALRAERDTHLAEIINKADLSLPDGRGFAWAARYLYGIDIEVVPGRKLFEELMEESAKRGWRVFLLGGSRGVAAEAARHLSRKYEVLSIKYASGPWLNECGEPVDGAQRRVEQRVVEEINKFRPHLLFVGFGAPKQEKWLARNLPRLKVGVAMTVGGTLDYFAGKASLPPKVFDELGLEWLWRLLTQPWRAPRIFRAVVIFPLMVILEKIRKKKNY